MEEKEPVVEVLTSKERQLSGLKNLKTLTKEERTEIARKGGLAAAKAKRKKKTMRETMEAILSAKIPVQNIPKELQRIGITEEDMNVQTAIVYQQALKAIEESNTQAAEFCRNTAGEFIGAEVKEEKEDRVIYLPAKDIPSSFVDINRWIDDRKYLEYWFEGGRGSAKSSYWSEKTIEILENNPNMCAIVIRKVGNTLKDSVFSQLGWAIDQLNESYPGLRDDYKSTKSPLEINKLSTEQRIYFRGADDPGKIKSIKPPKGKYIGLIIFEEFDQMAGMNEVRKIDQSVVRGGEDFVIFRIYNTPASSQHFVNKEKLIPKENRYVHLSDYRNVPVEWLGQTFVDEAEYMKETNERIYNNEYLGLMTGSGGNVFENVELRKIEDDEINNFDYIYQGLDFGWFPDPLAWTKMCYRPNEKALYIFDEFKANKMSNADVWKYLQKEKGVTNDDMITADSAENKSIGDFRSYGSCMRGAIKGPGSVPYSMKWLSSLAKIVIDPERCPNSAREFSNYEFETDKDGNYISKYVDADNHFIDSVRYALNRIWKKKGN